MSDENIAKLRTMMRDEAQTFRETVCRRLRAGRAGLPAPQRSSGTSRTRTSAISSKSTGTRQNWRRIGRRPTTPSGARPRTRWTARPGRRAVILDPPARKSAACESQNSAESQNLPLCDCVQAVHVVTWIISAARVSPTTPRAPVPHDRPRHRCKLTRKVLPQATAMAGGRHATEVPAGPLDISGQSDKLMDLFLIGFAVRCLEECWVCCRPTWRSTSAQQTPSST